MDFPLFEPTDGTKAPAFRRSQFIHRFLSMKTPPGQRPGGVSDYSLTISASSAFLRTDSMPLSAEALAV